MYSYQILPPLWTFFSICFCFPWSWQFLQPLLHKLVTYTSVFPLHTYILLCTSFPVLFLQLIKHTHTHIHKDNKERNKSLFSPPTDNEYCENKDSVLVIFISSGLFNEQFKELFSKFYWINIQHTKVKPGIFLLSSNWLLRTQCLLKV